MNTIEKLGLVLLIWAAAMFASDAGMLLVVVVWLVGNVLFYFGDVMMEALIRKVRG